MRRPLMEFSTAIQQMVAIARAVSFKAQLVIMDEPTSSLDEREVAVLFDVMRQLRARGRRGHLRHAIGSTSSIRSATASRHARRPHGDGQPHGRHRQARARLGDARARPRDGPRPFDRLLRGARARRATRCCRPKGFGSDARCGTLASRCASRPDRRPRRPARLGPHRGRARDLRRRSAGCRHDPTDERPAGFAARARRGDRARRRLLQRGSQGGRHRSRHVGAREHHARHPAAADAAWASSTRRASAKSSTDS